MAATSDFSFDPIEEALEAFGKGEFVVVMDDESRENEGDLCIAASEITTEKMAFFIRHTRSVRTAFGPPPGRYRVQLADF
jgi:3,4-dihydroxy-2-butanone 4-phosphate synthase